MTLRTPEAERIWAENKKKFTGLSKIKCKCGRKIIVARQGGHAIKNFEICGTCKALGLEKSREEYLRLHKAKSKKTQFLIKDVNEDKGLKTKLKNRGLFTGERYDIDSEIIEENKDGGEK